MTLEEHTTLVDALIARMAVLEADIKARAAKMEEIKAHVDRNPGDSRAVDDLRACLAPDSPDALRILIGMDWSDPHAGWMEYRAVDGFPVLEKGHL